MLGAVFERFVEKSPISVMVRASLERVLGADRLDLWYERTAQKQYTRDLLFSSVYDLMNQVVFCVQPSVRAAYQAHQNDVGTSLVSVYNKLNGLETHTAAELVRYSAREFAPLIKHMGGERAPWLEGYRVKIVDGNCLEASEHRIKELREATGRALPGKSLVVYEPALGVVTDVLPCENGHAQERSLFGAVLETVEAGDLWIEDRNFCTRAFLCEIDKRGAFFVTREHQGLPFEILTPLRSYGRTPTGQGRSAARVCGGCARPQAYLSSPTYQVERSDPRRGDDYPHLDELTAPGVGHNRWLNSTANAGRWKPLFKHLEAYFHSEINTLGYPKAALFGFCLALVAYNLLAVVLAALRRVHGEEMVDEEVSLYYIANEITTTYHGMMIAIPEPEWDVFYAMSTADLAAILVELAQGVRLQAFRKSPRRPKKPHPQGKKPARKGHVSTAKLLMNRKANLVTP